MPDRIILDGMRFFAFHGNDIEERRLGQPFVVDLELETDLSIAGASDDLGDTINYAEVYRAVRRMMERTPRNLLEDGGAGYCGCRAGWFSPLML